jgi:tRNA A-37 threonylcarbamoyl transferase component Bud32
MVKDRPSSQIWTLDFGGESIYVKHMTAANDRRRSIMDDLKWEYRPSRAISIMKATIRMASAGLHAPDILLAIRRRHQSLVEDLLVMRTVEGVSLSNFLATNHSAKQMHKMLSMVGQRIAKMHQLHIMHGDLLPNNMIIIDEGEDLVWLDNDRTRSKPALMPAQIFQRNLAQIMYRLLNDYSWRDTKPLLEAYFDQMGWSGKQRRSAIAMAINKTRARKGSRTGRKQMDPTT